MTARDRPGRRTRSRRLDAVLLRWHRRIGLASFAVVVVTAVSGVLLNHARTLGLHQIDVSSRFVPERYGPDTDAPIRAFRAGDRWIAWLSRQLIVDGRTVASNVGAVVGARTAGPVLVVAANSELLLVANDGRIIERISASALPGNIERLGTDGEDRVVIETGKGLFRADAALLSWEPTSSAPAWSRQSQPPPKVAAAAREAVFGQGPSVERMMLEVHTGRILGPWGVYLFDAAALCLVVLAATGVVNALAWDKARSRETDSP